MKGWGRLPEGPTPRSGLSPEPLVLVALEEGERKGPVGQEGEPDQCFSLLQGFPPRRLDCPELARHFEPGLPGFPRVALLQVHGTAL